MNQEQSNALLIRYLRGRATTIRVVRPLDAEALAFRVARDARSISELVAHIAWDDHHWAGDIFRDGRRVTDAAPPMSGENAARTLELSRDRLYGWLKDPEAMSRIYVTPAGNPWTGADALMQIILHETHHRAQIALSLRAHGRPTEVPLP
jgi:uncharacterized damage-inducible protein DinB